MAQGNSEPILKKIATVTLNGTNEVVRWYFTDEAKKCSELYIVPNITLSESSAYNVCYNGINSASKVGQWSVGLSITSVMVIGITKAATINGTSVSRFAYASISPTLKNANPSYLGFRPNSTAATHSGTIEIWGWV